MRTTGTEVRRALQLTMVGDHRLLTLLYQRQSGVNLVAIKKRFDLAGDQFGNRSR